MHCHKIYGCGKSKQSCKYNFGGSCTKICEDCSNYHINENNEHLCRADDPYGVPCLPSDPVCKAFKLKIDEPS